MFLLLGRFVYKAVAPFILAAVIGAITLAVLGFDPVAMFTGWLTDLIHGIEFWLTCEVIGWAC